MGFVCPIPYRISNPALLRERALPGIEFVIRLLNFLKAHFCQILKIFTQVLHLVRMIFGCETAIGGFDFFPGGARGNIQDRVGIFVILVVGTGGAVFSVVGRVPGLTGAVFGASPL